MTKKKWNKPIIALKWNCSNISCYQNTRIWTRYKVLLSTKNDSATKNQSEFRDKIVGIYLTYLAF